MLDFIVTVQMSRVNRGKGYWWNNSELIWLPYLISVQAEAEGDLYVDDGYTFDYKNGAYIYMKFSFRGGRLVAK